MPLRSSLLALLATLALCSCNDIAEDLATAPEVRIDATYAVPLINSTVSLQDLVGETNGNLSVRAGEGGTVIFRYSGGVPPVGPQIVLDRVRQLTSGIFLPLTRNRLGAPFAVSGDLDIDDVRVSGGQAFYNFTNTYDQAINVEISIEGATRGEEAFVITRTIPASSGEGDVSSVDNGDTPIDLTGFELTVPNDSIYINYTVTGEDGTDLPPASGSVFQINDLEFSLIRGYLGQELYEGGRDTISVDFFDSYLEGDLYFADPTVTVRLISTFGLPAVAQVEVLQVQDVNGNIIPITGPAITDGFDFDFPTTPGDSAVTEFVFTKENSNVDEVLSARPVALDYQFDANVNPDGDRSIRGFITDSSAYRAEVDIDLPLFGNATGFTVRDTLKVNLMEDYGDIADVIFRLSSDNGLPFAIEATGIFLDESGAVVEDLADGELIVLRPPAINTDGVPTGRERANVDFQFAGQRLERIRAADRLVLTFTITSSGGGTPFVRVTDVQELSVSLGALVNVQRN